MTFQSINANEIDHTAVHELVTQLTLVVNLRDAHYTLLGLKFCNSAVKELEIISMGRNEVWKGSQC